MNETPSNMILDIPRRCGECGYELTGLATSGKCPECGGEYSEKVVTLFGRGPQPQWSVWVWGFSAIIFGLWSVREARQGGWWLTSFLAFVAMQNLWLVWMHFDPFKLGRRLVQVRISSDGFGQRRGYGPIAPRQWRKGDRIAVEGPRPGQLHISVASNRQWSPIAVMIRTDRNPHDWSEFLNQIIAKTPEGKPINANSAPR